MQAGVRGSPSRTSFRGSALSSASGCSSRRAGSNRTACGQENPLLPASRRPRRPETLVPSSLIAIRPRPLVGQLRAFVPSPPLYPSPDPTRYIRVSENPTGHLPGSAHVPPVLRATWVRSPPPPGDGSHAYRIPRHRFFQDIDGACFLEIKEEPMFKTLVAFWTDPL